MPGRLLDYLAQGLAASRPAAIDMPARVVAGGAAIYYAYDTTVFSFFDEDAVDWVDLDFSVLTGLYADLSDVDWTTPATDGQVMIYDLASSKWIPGDFPAIPTTEQIQDLIAAMMVNGTGITITYDDGLGTLTIATTITQYTDEMVRDVMGVALVQGAGITITPNDGADTITIACSVTQYTDEMARDALGTALVQSGLVTVTVNDGADTITIAVPAAVAADFLTGTSATKALTPDAVWDSAVGVVLADGATVTPDFATGINFTWTIAGNRTLANPTNVKPGQTGCIEVTQDGTGSRLISAYGSNYQFAGGTDIVLSTAIGARDLLFYYVTSDSKIFLSAQKAIAA